MRTEIEIYSQITVHAVSMFVIRALHHVALHSVYAYSRTESIAPMARGSPDAGTHNLLQRGKNGLYVVARNFCLAPA